MDVMAAHPTLDFLVMGRLFQYYQDGMPRAIAISKLCVTTCKRKADGPKPMYRGCALGVHLDTEFKHLATAAIIPLTLPVFGHEGNNQSTKILAFFGGSLKSQQSGFCVQAFIQSEKEGNEPGGCPELPRIETFQRKFNERVLCIIPLRVDDLLLVENVKELLGKHGKFQKIEGRSVSFSWPSPPDDHKRQRVWKKSRSYRLTDAIPREYRESVKEHILLFALPNQILLCDPLTLQPFAVLSGISITCEHVSVPPVIAYMKELSLLAVVCNGEKEVNFFRVTTLSNGIVGFRFEASMNAPASGILMIPSKPQHYNSPWAEDNRSTKFLISNTSGQLDMADSVPPVSSRDDEFTLLSFGEEQITSVTVRTARFNVSNSKNL